MALPVTISGLSTTVAPIGPFKSTASRITITTTTQSTSTTFGSTTVTAYGQTWTTNASATPITQITAIIGISGSPSDTLVCTIYAVDGSNLPTGSALATSSPVTATATVCPPFVFPVPWTPSASTKYAAVFTRTGAASNTNNYLFWGAASSVYASGEPLSYNGTTWSTATNDKYLDVQGAGAYYFLGADSTTNSTLRAYKSTAPDTSWSVVTSQTGHGSINVLSGVQVGNIIHIANGYGDAAQASVGYEIFDMASDTFPFGNTPETVAGGGGVSTGQTGAMQHGVGLVVRANGDVIAFFNGLQTKTSGTFRARLYYSRRAAGGTTWATEVQVDANAANDAIYPEAVLGVSDIVHFFHKSASSTLSHRALSAANALQTASTVTLNGDPPGQALSFVGFDATVKVAIGQRAASNANGILHNYFNSAATPTVSVGGNSGIPGANGSGTVGIRSFNDGNDIWTLFTDTALDLNVTKSTNFGSTSGSTALVVAASIAAADTNFSKDGNIYLRGTNIVLPYLVNDGGTWKYNEYTIRTYYDDAWNAADKAPSLTLSGSDRIVTGSSGVSSGVRSTTKYPKAVAGKYYAEIKLDNYSGSGNIPIMGLLDASSSLAGSGNNYYVQSNGAVYFNTGLTGTNLGQFADEDVLGIAWDTTAGKVWFRKNSGNWNNNASSDPATGSIGLDASTWTASTFALWALIDASGEAVSLRTKRAEFTLGVPSGFASWMGETIPTIADAWDASDKTATITLSNSDKTATAGTSGLQGVRSTTAHASGTAAKYYVEFKIANWISSSTPYVGVQLGTDSLTVDTHSLVFDANVNIFVNGSLAVNFASPSNFADNDIICMAWDTAAQKVWFRVNSGNWNDNAAADPAAGTNGASTSALTSGNYKLWSLFNATSEAVTVRTKVADLTLTPPIGFMSWMGEVIPTADAWNVADKNSIVALSNSDKTATSTSTSVGPVRSTKTYPASGTAKLYAEIVIGVVGGSLNTVGIHDTTTSVSSNFFNTSTKSLGYSGNSTGFMTLDGNTVASGMGGLATGDIVCVAWDTVNKRGWLRKNGGNWNNDSSANPATNTNGFDVSTLTGSGALAGAVNNQDNYVTIRTEIAEFTVGSYPSGFTSWMGETMGPPNTNLVAAAGSYSLVGAATPVTVLLKRKLPANTPSPAYALAGPAIPVGLNKGKILLATAASPAYLLVGAATPVRLLRGLKLTAQVPSSAYALVGAATPVRLLYGRKAAALTPASPYLLVGAATPVNLFHGYKIQVTPAGNYSLVGAATPVRLLYGRKLAAAALSTPYLLVGTDAALTKGTGLVNKILDATTPGAYSLVGAATPVKLLRQRKLDATTPSSYSLVAPATPVRLLYGLKVQATAPGAYSLVAAASPALLLRGRNLAASAPLSPYLLVGAASPVLLTYRRKMVATTPGAYSLIGTDITILKGAAKAMAAAAGTYSLVAPATPVALLHTYKPAAGVGTYSLTGATTTNLRKNLPLLVTPPGNYLLTGQAALERLGRVVTITPANYSLVGAATPIKLLHKYRLDATPVGAYSLVGAATPVNLLHKYRLDATPVGAYSLVGAATPVKLLHKYIVTVVASSYTLNGAAVPTNLLHKYRPAAGVGAYSLVGAATPVALLHKYKPSALAGIYTLTGTDATLAKLVLRNIAVVPGSYSLVPAATPVNLRINLPLIAGAGVYLLTGQAAFERVGKVLTANNNSYLLTGAATPANLLHKYRPVAAAGAYSLTGTAAGVAKGGAQQLVPNLYMDPDSFYPASLSILQNLYPALYLDPDTFYPAYISYKQFLTPDLFLDPDSFPQSTIEVFYGDTEAMFVRYENRRMHVPAKHRMMTVSAEDRSMEVLRSDRDMDVESRRRAG